MYTGPLAPLPKYSLPLGHSVVPAWIERISFQQQTVLMLALRGPDGVRKHHPAKQVHVAYRGTIIRAAKQGRFLYWGERSDSFMSLDLIASEHSWDNALNLFFSHIDELPHHYVSHLAHAAQIVAVYHPHAATRAAWGKFYARWVDDKHLEPETTDTMDARLNDFGQAPARLAEIRPELYELAVERAWVPPPIEPDDEDLSEAEPKPTTLFGLLRERIFGGAR